MWYNKTKEIQETCRVRVQKSLRHAHLPGLLTIRTQAPDQAARVRPGLFAAPAEAAVRAQHVVALVLADLLKGPGPAADLADLGQALRVAHAGERNT